MLRQFLLVIPVAFASISSANDFVFNPSEWPPISLPVRTGDGASPPPPNSTFSALLPSDFPTTPPVRRKEDNPQTDGTCPTNGNDGPTGSCWWTCAEGKDGFPCSTPEDARDCQPGKWGLSYDDGPTNETSTLLDMLKSKNLKATFCMIGSQVVRFPNETKRIYEEGHDLCIHTWSHSPLTTQTNDVVLAELKYTEMAIEAVTGVRPEYFRPPYGDTDNRIRNIAQALGYKQLLWKYDSSDYNAFPDVTNPLTMNDLVAGLDSNVTASWPDGLISLEHAEKAVIGVEFAGKVIDTAGSKYQLVPVSTCLNDATPWISNSNLVIDSKGTTPTNSSDSPSNASNSTSSGISNSSNSPVSPVNPIGKVTGTSTATTMSSVSMLSVVLSVVAAASVVI